MPMKIVDCFPFFNEEHHLILRIGLLKDVVDKIVICEGNRTHSGILKAFTCESILRKHNLLLDKVQILKVDLPSIEETNDHWIRERKQRDSAASLIKEDEIWIISDCDEIPNPSTLDYYINVAQNNLDKLIHIPMYSLYMQASLELQDIYGNSKPSIGSFLCTKSHVANHTLSELRESTTTQVYKPYPNLIPYVPDENRLVCGGWHLSWMGSSSERLKKLNSFAHATDYLKYGIGDLQSQNAKDFIRDYIPKPGSLDILRRVDHILNKFPLELLPSSLLQTRFLKDYYLPKFEHIYTRENFGENWFTYPKLYRQMVDRFPSLSTFVEVGSWKGKSSAYMAVEIANSGKDINFYCVDTWKGSIEHQHSYDTSNLYETFLKNMEPVENYYIPLHLSSEQASKKFKPNSLDFVFIDASHEFEDVLRDLVLWYPKVKKGGVLAGHDYYADEVDYGQGVKKAVNYLFRDFQVTDENCFLIEK